MVDERYFTAPKMSVGASCQLAKHSIRSVGQNKSLIAR